jgi:ribosomal protein L10
MNRRLNSRNSKQRNEDWILKYREMSEWKSEILTWILKHREMSDKELRDLRNKLSQKKLNN